jgi:gentisate 1,2-dioxygenase
MPAGQLYDALRGALFFDGAAVASPIAVLTGWLVAGLALMWLGEVAATRSHTAVAMA